jgi:hypothetical protein
VLGRWSVDVFLLGFRLPEIRGVGSLAGVARRREKHWSRLCAGVCCRRACAWSGDCCTQREALGEEEAVAET